MENPAITLPIFALILLVEGIIYAWQIKETPVTAGHTFLSVGTGVAMILIGDWAIRFMLKYYGLADWDIYSLIAPVVLLGGPMFVAQWHKKYQTDKETQRIKKEGNFDL